jgi:hypothetical protein
MINSELLKSAIADAKAVRAAALANAKAQLEEAFAPRFEAMFAEKLKEDSEEEQEENVSEVSAPNQVSGKGGEAKGPATKDVSKGQPVKKSDGATQYKAVKAGKGPSDVGNPTKKVNETAEEEDEETMDENAVAPQAEAGLTSEDLDEIIAELEQECGDEEGGEAPPADPSLDAAPAPEGGEGEGEVPPMDPTAALPPPAAPMAGSAPAPMAPPVAPLPAPVGGEVPGGAPAPVAPPVAGQPPVGDDEDINLDELLAALNEESGDEDKDEEKVDESTSNHGVPKGVDGQDKSGGVKGYPAAPKDASKKQDMGKNHNIQGKGNIGTGAVGGKPKMEEATKYKVALKESYKTIEFLRGQINEVNLLNAKLLYTNKLFKEFAGVLDDPYRMKIVESFDLTKSVREVKLAYALLAESLNFGTKVVSTRPAARPVVRSSVKQITEGLASKTVAGTKPSKEILSEGVVSDMASRFKKLAGIPTKK